MRFTWIKNMIKSIFKRIQIGIKLGWNTPTLPYNVF